MNVVSAARAVTAMFPCCNDATTIGTLIDDVHATLSPLVDEVEVVVVDDGSTDGSGALLDGMAGTRPWLRVVHHERNGGYGAALRSGFAAARLDWIFYTDGDGQYDPAEVALLLPRAVDGVGLVQGHKIRRSDNVVRRVVGTAYHHVVKLLFHLPVRDTDCDFRLFRRDLLRAGPLTCSSGAVCVELLHRVRTEGARVVEVPVHHRSRPSGRSQFFRLPHLSRTARELPTLWWRLIVRRSNAGGT